MNFPNTYDKEPLEEKLPINCFGVETRPTAKIIPDGAGLKLFKSFHLTEVAMKFSQSNL